MTTESGSASETVHDSKAEAFRWNDFTENHLKAFLVQLPKDAEQLMGDLFRGSKGSDIMGIAMGEHGDMLRETKHTAFLSQIRLFRVKLLQRRDNPVRGALDEGYGRLGRVVPVAHAGRKSGLILAQGTEHAAGHSHFALKHAADHFLRHTAGSEDDRITVAQVQDSGFQADVAHAAVNNQRDFPVHVLQHMGSRGRARPAGTVRGRSGNGKIADLQHPARNGMGRHPDGDGGQAGRHFIRDRRFLFTEDRQRSGPEFPDQGKGTLRNDAQGIQLGKIVDMYDERIVRGTALGGENGQDGILIQRVGAEAVDRFRGEGDQAAVLQDFRGTGVGFLSRGKHEGIQKRSLPVFLFILSVFSARRSASINGERSPFITPEVRLTVRFRRWSTT